MLCKIPSIDSALKKGFPTSGLVAVIGSSSIYQVALIKDLVKNISENFNEGIVISTQFMSWATRDFSETSPNMSLLETEQNEIYDILRNICSANNWNGYNLIAIDSVEGQSSMIDFLSFKKLLQTIENKLVIVNCHENSRHHSFDLKNLLVSSAKLTLKVEEENDGHGVNVKISIFGPQIVE